MSTSRKTNDPAARLESTLLTQLGLGGDATPERIDATHDAVVGFLASAPRNLRGWARSQAAAADQAYALLSDPAALARSAALAEPASLPAPAPDGPVATPARQAAPSVPSAPKADRQAADREEQLSADDELDELIAAVTPSAHRDEVQRPRTRRQSQGDAVSRKGRLIPVRRLVAVAALVAGAAIVAVVGYNFGGGGGAPVSAANVASPTPGASAQPTLDAGLVASLMTKIQANPKDTQTLLSLGDAFFQAGQYQTAADWLAKLVKLDPKNTQALVALGAADYNNGDVTNAETYWKQAIALDPKSVEAHYDLGFLYLRKQPPDTAGMQREWQQVVALAPGTQVAQNVQAHLDALASPGPSGAASANPATSASPAASTQP